MAISSKGKALVTGASTGIGAIYADRLAKRGFDLVVVARNEKQLRELAARIESGTGRSVEVLPADLSKEADLQVVEQKVIGDPDLTLLVNNAGIAGSAKLADDDLEEIDNIIKLNILALTHLSAAAAKSFAARGRGTIINIASVLGLIPERFNATYSASKAYVLALTQSLNVELQGSGVKVQAVLPGATRTEIWQRSGHDVNALPAEMVMDADEMVDAALAGLDQGELVTIPSLPDVSDWKRFEDARGALAPNLSLQHAATRYKHQRPAA
ncbi:MAG: SDR family oxidoreductase [Hyphomicrobium sp.]